MKMQMQIKHIGLHYTLKMTLDGANDSEEEHNKRGTGQV